MHDKAYFFLYFNGKNCQLFAIESGSDRHPLSHTHTHRRTHIRTHNMPRIVSLLCQSGNGYEAAMGAVVVAFAVAVAVAAASAVSASAPMLLLRCGCCCYCCYGRRLIKIDEATYGRF